MRKRFHHGDAEYAEKEFYQEILLLYELCNTLLGNLRSVRNFSGIWNTRTWGSTPAKAQSTPSSERKLNYLEEFVRC